MAEEPKHTKRQHIAENHPELPEDVIDGLAELAHINTHSGVEQDVDTELVTDDEHGDDEHGHARHHEAGDAANEP